MTRVHFELILVNANKNCPSDELISTIWCDTIEKAKEEAEWYKKYMSNRWEVCCLTKVETSSVDVDWL